MVNVLLFTEAKFLCGLYTRPQGAYRIATEIRNAGYTCQVIDFASEFSITELLLIVDKYINKDTLAICFSNTFFTSLKVDSVVNRSVKYTEDIYMTRDYIIKVCLRYAKLKNPTLKVIIGGAKSYDIDIKKHPEIDVICLGYADEIIIDVLKKIENEKDTKATNQLIVNGYPKTAFRSFDFRKSKTRYEESDFLDYGKESLTLEVSRGCKFNCKFCAFPMNGRRGSFLQYTKDADTLYEEIMENYNTYGVTSYFLCDDTFNESEEKLDYIGNIFNRLPFDLKFGAWTRHDLIYHHRDMAHKLLDMGLVVGMFGIETFSDSAAKIIGKGLGANKTKELLHWLKHDVWKKDINTYSGFIIGLPTESPIEARKNITDYFLSNDCNLDSFITLPLEVLHKDNQLSTEFNRISEFERSAEKYGFVINKNSYLDWSHADYTFKDAFEISDYLNKFANSISNLSGMVLIGLLGYGYDLDYLLSFKHYRFHETFVSTNVLFDKTQKYKNKILQ